MIQKAPSCYIGDLALAIRLLFNADNEIVTIGTRHGEKRYEVLMTKEEAAKAEDLGSFFRIPSDNRNLNYEHMESGSHAITEADEYNSQNTVILTIEQIAEKLKEIPEVQKELITWSK